MAQSKSRKKSVETEAEVEMENIQALIQKINPKIVPFHDLDQETKDLYICAIRIMDSNREWPEELDEAVFGEMYKAAKTILNKTEIDAEVSELTQEIFYKMMNQAGNDLHMTEMWDESHKLPEEIRESSWEMLRPYVLSNIFDEAIDRFHKTGYIDFPELKRRMLSFSGN